jgi:hypothetical protein
MLYLESVAKPGLAGWYIKIRRKFLPCIANHSHKTNIGISGILIHAQVHVERKHAELVYEYDA